MASAQQAAEIKVIEIRKKQETDNLVRASGYGRSHDRERCGNL